MPELETLSKKIKPMKVMVIQIIVDALRNVSSGLKEILGDQRNNGDYPDNNIVEMN